MGSTRRKFGTEFKREAARRPLQPGNTVAAVAQDLGVHESVLRRRIKECGAGPVGKATERSQEIARLKRELARITMAYAS